MELGVMSMMPVMLALPRRLIFDLSSLVFLDTGIDNLGRRLYCISKEHSERLMRCWIMET
jgi:hypothetical protein